MNADIQKQLPLSSSFWQQIDFFKGVPRDILKDLLSGSEIICTNAKKIIFHEGEPAEHFGFVIEGFFKLFRSHPPGRNIIMDFSTSGGMIASLLMASEDSVYPVTVQSIGPGRFLKIPKATFNEYWVKSSEIMKKVQNENMQRVGSLLTMREAQRLPLAQRVAWVLIRLLGKHPENNKYLKVYFTRADIADAIGASPESVIRVFSQWLKDGLIEVKSNEEFINLSALNEKFLFSR